MILIGVYFRRLKENHDSHEFILESRTVANKYVHEHEREYEHEN
jgi:hypothetical protein